MATTTARAAANATPTPVRRNTGTPTPTGGSATTTVSASALDLAIPTIREPKEADILARFEFAELDKIEGRPNYTSLKNCRKQLARNALKIQSIFGGGRHGHVGLVYKPTIYAKEQGTQPWRVPPSQGMYPLFPAGATDNEKKIEITKFVQIEEHIKKAETMERLLRNQILKAIDDDYLCELKSGILEYDGCKITEIFDHLFKNHGSLSIALRQDTMKTFHDAPEWDKPIDVYFNRQQECQKTMEDTRTPITDATMIEEMVVHMAQSGIVNKARQKWERHLEKKPADHNWKFAKNWFRRELKEVREAEEDAGQETKGVTFQAKVNLKEEELKEEVRAEMSQQMKSSIDALV